jgi:hypothetical protein
VVNLTHRGRGRTSSPLPAARSQYLLDLLAQVPGPRKRLGRRHALAGLPAVGIAAVIAGSKSFAAIGQRAADAGPEVQAALGPARGPGPRPRRPAVGWCSPSTARPSAARELVKAFADLAGAVLTTGAMHTQHDTAQVIPDRGADYVMTVKASMPGLYEQLKKLPWACIPSVSPVSTGHGRRARRRSRPRWRRPGPGSTVPSRSRTCAAWPSASRA